MEREEQILRLERESLEHYMQVLEANERGMNARADQKRKNRKKKREQRRKARQLERRDRAM